MNWHDLAADDHLPAAVMEITGELPKRWGRMDLASRVALVAVGRLLRAEGLLSGFRVGSDKCIGLVVATDDGCMITDLEFSRLIGAGETSPMLFGYTLANIPLAEAASHYGLTGPVYAVYGDATAAANQAAGWLKPSGPAELMITGTLNLPASGGEITVNIEVI